MFEYNGHEVSITAYPTGWTTVGYRAYDQITGRDDALHVVKCDGMLDAISTAAEAVSLPYILEMVGGGTALSNEGISELDGFMADMVARVNGYGDSWDFVRYDSDTDDGERGVFAYSLDEDD